MFIIRITKAEKWWLNDGSVIWRVFADNHIEKWVKA